MAVRSICCCIIRTHSYPFTIYSGDSRNWDIYHETQRKNDALLFSNIYVNICIKYGYFLFIYFIFIFIFFFCFVLFCLFILHIYSIHYLHF